MDRKCILSEIIRTAQENGGQPLGREKFQKVTGIRTSDWYGKFWPRWGDALVEADFSPNQKTERLNDEYVLAAVARLTKELGQVPTWAELRIRRRTDKNLPSHTTIARMGSRTQLLEQLKSYCGRHSEFSEVAPICNQALEARPEAAKHSEVTVEAVFGFVYMIKSGGYYKIGRSNAAGRRERELAIQLPEKATTVHVMRTDDPNGIEEYWHKRFESKRMNGEWFQLTSSDIQAFKRRKFM